MQPARELPSRWISALHAPYDLTLISKDARDVGRDSKPELSGGLKSVAGTSFGANTADQGKRGTAEVVHPVDKATLRARRRPGTRLERRLRVLRE